MTLSLPTFNKMVASFGVYGPMPGTKPVAETQEEVARNISPEDGDEEESAVKVPKVSALNCNPGDEG